MVYDSDLARKVVSASHCSTYNTVPMNFKKFMFLCYLFIFLQKMYNSIIVGGGFNKKSVNSLIFCYVLGGCIACQ